MNNTNYSYLNSGSQKCLKNTDFESESEKSLQISQADSGYDDTSLQKPDFILKPRSVEVNEGQSAIFLCRTRGNPPPKIEWKKQGETIHPDSRHKITYGDDCILEIKRTTSRDSGSYTCVLTNPAGTVTMETTLVVKMTKTEPEAPSDFKSTFRRVSKQEETLQNRAHNSPKLSNSQERIDQTISTPVNMERGATRSRFSPVSQNNPGLKSPGSNLQSSSLSEKIERFQKLEQKSPQSPKGFDFRSVLKPKQNVDSKVKLFANSIGSSDGASKKKFQDVLSQRHQTQLREVTPSRSKTDQEISSPSWKSHSPLKKSGENSPHKTVFNNLGKSDTEKVDFRSVLKKKENSSVKEVQSSESSKQNKIQGEIVKEVNNNESIKPEISRWRRDFTKEKSAELQPAGKCVDEKKSITDKFKSDSKDQILNKNQNSVKDKTQNDIQHVWSHRKTNNFEQQKQETKRETPPLGLPNDPPSKEMSSNTQTTNGGCESSETPQQVKKSSVVSKLQEQTTKQDDGLQNDIYANDSVKKLEVSSNYEKSNARSRHVNFRFIENSDIKVEKEISVETNQTSENSVLHGKVKNASNVKEGIPLIETKSKEPSVNLQKRSSTFESPIKLDVKEDYKSILTKRKSEPDLKEKQLRDLRAIERFSMLSDKKRTEKSENKTPENTEKEDDSVGSESIVTADLKTRGLNTKLVDKEEARGGIGKFQSLNGSHEPGKSNKSQFGSDRKIIDSSIPRDEPRSVLKRRRSSSSFNKNDKLSPTGLDPSADTRLRQPPSFQTVLQNQSVNEGESVTMECHVTGLPKPGVTWYMKDTLIKPSKFFRMTYEDNLAKLVIAGAYPEDVGTYSCVAANSSGTERCSCHLFVQECPSTTSNNQSDEEMPPDTPTQKTPLDPPKSTDQYDEDVEEPKTPKLVAPYINEINPTDQTVIAGQKAVFQGSFTSDGKTEVRWYKGTEEIHTSDKRTVSTTEHLSRLTIHNVQPVDRGAYQIVVENKAGSVSAVLSLSVQDVPDPPVGKPYASEVSLYSIILSWCGPAYDGGSQVTGYKVEICKAEEETWETLTSSCHSTSFSVDNLEAHTPYFFRVSAKNKNGLSKPSEMSNVVVTKDRRRSIRLSVESDEEDLPFSPRVINISTTRKFEDDYDLKDGVGKGKFGSVSKCTEKSSGQIFAAKFVKCRSSREKDNIRQEVEIMNQLTHPKLVLLWDAFETARSMVLVMEYVAGGELFDRVVDEDLELSERDCVHFVRQICEGVQYMHNKSIMHLDLKPENILCVKKGSNLIKIIDFGLARPCKEDEGLRVMFGTPEFIAPEVVNYEVIGLPTDIWSLGVICYVLLSGLSPFMGDSDVETLSNVTRGDFDFDDDAFDEISEKAKDFIEISLQKNKNKRPTVEQCLEHKWLAQSAERNSSKKLRQSLRNLKQFMARRKWQKMGNAIRAVGRMSSAMQKLQKSRSDSSSSAKSENSDNTSQSPIESSSTVSSTEDKNTDKLSSRDIVAKGISSTHEKTIPKKENSVQSESIVQRDLNKNLTHRQTENDNKTSKQVNMFSKPVHSEPDSSTHHDKHRTNRESTEKENKQIHNQSFSKREKLKFLKEMVDCEAFEGDIVRFDVQISGDNEPTIEWYFEDTLIHQDRQHSFSEVNSENGEFSLIIRNVNENNEGEYMCKVSDSSGEITCFAELSVLGSGAF